jgi:hypothetical protein
MDFLKKNWYFVIPTGLLLSPLLIIFYISATYGYNFSESAAVLANAGKSNTKFQHMQFSEAKFREIHPGMMGRDVYEVLGLPLERHDNDTRWLYSLPVGGAEYFHERTVVMDHGKVTGTINRFHTPESK